MSDLNKTEKVGPRLSPVFHRYLEDLVATGIYGPNKTQAARALIEDGVRRAIAAGLIKLRKQSQTKASGDAGGEG